MSYSDEWLKAVRAAHHQASEPKPDEFFTEDWREARSSAREKPARPVRPVRPVMPAASASAWKPWAEMTAEERRKALEKREGEP